MFFGIFFHGNHHKMAMLFNPMNVPTRAATRQNEEARSDAGVHA